MERHTMAVKIKENKMNEFRKKLGEIWEELVKWLDKNGVKNFSIWNAENLIFIYGEWQYGGGYQIDDDELISQRGDTIDPGPDSNFSIWSAGGYIFGYDEIDITMEKEETEKEHTSVVEWEIQQLEIMDWITNDVDWLTGERHVGSVRLAWHA